MRSGSAFRLLVCVSLVLFASRIAAASTIHVVIKDPAPGPLEALFISGSGTFDVSVLPPFAVVQPAVGHLGQVDNRFEDRSGDPGSRQVNRLHGTTIYSKTLYSPRLVTR